MDSESTQTNQDNATVRTNVIVFGEVLFDCFPNGRRVLGGAPFNVAWGLKGFDLDPVLITAVGVDDDGSSILESMSEWGMRTDGIQSHVSLATGTVDVSLVDGDAQYEIPAPRAWDEITDMNFAAQDFLYHGSLALRSDVNRATLAQIVKRSGAQRFFDVNLRPPHTPLDRVKEWLSGAAWVKCNLEELQLLLGLPSLSFSESVEAAQALMDSFSVKNVLVTAGGEGARAVGETGIADMPPPSSSDIIVDTVGAGDSFSAVFIHGRLTGRPVQESLAAAGKFARKVCLMQGATTLDPAFYQQNRGQENV